MKLGDAKLEIQNLRCSLGEGPHWDTDRDSLYFVDILGQKIFSYNLSTRELKSKDVDSPPGCIIPTNDNNKCIVCTQKGIQVIAFDEPNIILLMDRNNMEKNKEFNRFNDGKVDPAGRLWVGTMASNGKGHEGSLFCFTDIHKCTLERQNVGISNGIAWSTDSKTMYYIDSTPKRVFAFDYDVHTGMISRERVIFELNEEGSVPDGMTIDSQDFLWIAIWGGKRVIRVNPVTGKEVASVHVPAKNVTSCCFGGPNLTTLFITTASHDTDTNSFPLAGGVFSFETDVMGMNMNSFKIANLEVLCLERAEANIIKILYKSSEVTNELSRLEPDLTGDNIKRDTQEVLQLCQSIRQDMRVPIQGLNENFHFTNNMSIYGPRKDLELALRRSQLIYDLLIAMKPQNKNTDFDMV